jgi:hypothetical protein
MDVTIHLLFGGRREFSRRPTHLNRSETTPENMPETIPKTMPEITPEPGEGSPEEIRRRIVGESSENRRSIVGVFAGTEWGTGMGVIGEATRARRGQEGWIQ